MRLIFLDKKMKIFLEGKRKFPFAGVFFLLGKDWIKKPL
jgi:hypothetical protein